MSRVKYLEERLWTDCRKCIGPAYISLAERGADYLKVSVPKLDFTDYCLFVWNSGEQKGFAANNSDFSVTLENLPEGAEITVKAAYRCFDEEGKKWGEYSEEFVFETKEGTRPCSNYCNTHSVSRVLRPIWEAVHYHDVNDAVITWSMRPAGHGTMLAPNPNYDPTQPVGPGNWEFIMIPSIEWDQPTITTAQWLGQFREVFSQYEVLFKELFDINVTFQETLDFDNADIRVEQTQSNTGSGTLATASPVKKCSGSNCKWYIQIRFFLDKKWEIDCANQPGAFSVGYVFSHELGHGFGLAHGSCYMNGENYRIMAPTASTGKDLCDGPYSGNLINDLYIKDCIYSVFSNPNLQFL